MHANYQYPRGNTMIKLFTDTSANLPISLIRRYNIEVVPFSYTIDGKCADYSHETDFDGKRFYDAMREGAEIKTSMISLGAFLDAFSRSLDEGYDVLYIGMSGGISSTAHSAQLAVAELCGKYPDRRLAAVDTFAASLGEGLLVLHTARLIAKGKTFDEIHGEILERRNTMCQFFTVDNLEYLKRGGRISGAVAFVGTLLNIKPLLKGDETGHIIMHGKARGSKKALDSLAEKFAELVTDKSALLGIAHADNERGTQYLLGKLREKGFLGECLTVCYEPVTGSHVGPGTVALFFNGRHK